MEISHFIKRIGIFLLLGIILLNLPKIFLNKYYGNKTYSAKYSYFIDNAGGYNAVFYGSSRVYRQINPSVDPVNSGKDFDNYHIFNMGAPATYNPESYFLLENFLKTNDEINLDYIFVEVQNLNNIHPKNASTFRNYYWQNLRSFLYAMNYSIVGDTSGGKFPLLNFSGYGISLIYKYLIPYDDLSYIKFGHSSEDSYNFDKNGFYSLDDQLMNAKDKTGLNNRVQYLIENPSIIDDRRSSASYYIDHPDLVPGRNSVHVDKLLEIKRLANLRGIKLVLFVPPLLPDYKEIYSVINYIPDVPVINLSDPYKYSDLYIFDNCFDKGHLNSQGSKILSNYFFRELSKLSVN